jgi:molybdenum cofactor cytidylyltransferase
MRTGDVGIVVLAAGESVRMGEPKQLLPFQGATLLQHAVQTALSLHAAAVTVVLGAHEALIRPTLAELPVTIVANPDWQTGMGASLRAGLGTLLTTLPNASAALFLLCDQPQVTSDLLQTLIARWREGADMAACRYETRCGVPAIFDHSLFPELLALQGAAGARQVLAAHADRVSAIDFPASALDVDTPADYAALLAQSPDIPPSS